MNVEPTSSSKHWLSLSEAAELLGVHFTTLRRWADQGIISHMRTPGGRRRFKLLDLQKFLWQTQHNKTEGNKQTDSLSFGSVNIQLSMQNESWMHKFGELDRIKLRGSGQMMFGLLLQYAARSENNLVFLEEAMQIAQDVGAVCARSEMTVIEVVEAFLLFRNTIMEMVLKSSTVQFSQDKEGRQIHLRTNEYMDALLLSIITSYNKTHPLTVER